MNTNPLTETWLHPPAEDELVDYAVQDIINCVSSPLTPAQFREVCEAVCACYPVPRKHTLSMLYHDLSFCCSTSLASTFYNTLRHAETLNGGEA